MTSVFHGHTHTLLSGFHASCPIPGPLWWECPGHRLRRSHCTASCWEPLPPSPRGPLLWLCWDIFMAGCLDPMTFCEHNIECAGVSTAGQVEWSCSWDRRWRRSCGHVMAAWILLSEPQTTRVQDPEGCLVSPAIFLATASWCWAGTMGSHYLYFSLGKAEKNRRLLWFFFLWEEQWILSFSPHLSLRSPSICI